MIIIYDDGDQRTYSEVSVSVSVETRRSDDLYPGSSPDGDEVGAERGSLCWAEMAEGRRWGEADLKYSWTTRGEPTMDGEVTRGATTLRSTFLLSIKCCEKGGVFG